MPESKSSSQKPYDLEPNVEAALSYIPVVGVVVYLMEKENKFVRFHALQSILFWIVVFALGSMASSLTVILIGFILMPLITMGSVVLWIYLTWEAYNEREFELPYLGKIVKKQVYK